MWGHTRPTILGPSPDRSSQCAQDTHEGILQRRRQGGRGLAEEVACHIGYAARLAVALYEHLGARTIHGATTSPRPPLHGVGRLATERHALHAEHQQAVEGEATDGVEKVLGARAGHHALQHERAHGRARRGRGRRRRRGLEVVVVKVVSRGTSPAVVQASGLELQELGGQAPDRHTEQLSLSEGARHREEALQRSSALPPHVGNAHPGEHQPARQRRREGGRSALGDGERGAAGGRLQELQQVGGQVDRGQLPAAGATRRRLRRQRADLRALPGLHQAHQEGLLVIFVRPGEQRDPIANADIQGPSQIVRRTGFPEGVAAPGGPCAQGMQQAANIRDDVQTTSENPVVLRCTQGLDHGGC
mmetsp:Transcript_122024/g.390170  ORF Transcript_122024/g.390170 Transcript_122024/m.390170 type:complete len:361 (+) Transcript_122024:1817-2899(+)